MLIRSFEAPIGADVLDVDINSLTEEEFTSIYNAWLRFGVLRIRNQSLDDEALRFFSARFGELEYAPHGNVTKNELAEIPNPYVATISNIVENGRPIGGLSNVETSWHTDMSYIEKPPTASLLYAVEVPAFGGETSYCCMRTALSEMPQELREKCSQLRIKHDAAHDSIGKMRRGYSSFSSPSEAPGVLHPTLIEHPETNEQALYLGRRLNAYIDGADGQTNEELLDQIWTYVAKDSHCWTQRWQEGDLVIWDNRIVMHRRASFPNSERRLMRRTQVRATQAPIAATLN